MSEQQKNHKNENHDSSKRDFLKKSAYVAPVVLTLSATPNLVAAHGSVVHDTERSGGQISGSSVTGV